MYVFRRCSAVEGMNIQMDNDEILGIIGPNGSGKSTLINVLTGVYKPTAGEVFFNGQNITGLKQHKIAELGIARTFQNLRVFTAMTVRDNVVTGNHINIRAGFVDSLLHTRKFKNDEARAEKGSRRAARIRGSGRYEKRDRRLYGLRSAEAA